ncbi:MAG: type II toxin-antitoxin system prevent-host-death family antitoxin [Caulobacterales bacterium]
MADAKDRLSEVVRRARGQRPQTIKVRGERAAIVLSASEYDALTAPDAPKTLKDLIRAMNLDGVDLTRDPRPARDIDL